MPLLIAGSYGQVWGLITLALCMMFGVGFIVLSYWSHKKEQETGKGLYDILFIVSGVIGGFIVLFGCVPPLW